MGDIVKSIGSALSPIARIAAPFIPGVGGALASVLGSVGPAQHVASQANANLGQQQDVANQQAALSKQLAQAIPGLMTQAGIGSDGQWNGGYNPYDQGATNIYGTDADISSRADSLYSPGALTPQIVAAREASAPAYDNAVSQYQADQLGRGFTQGDTATDANVAATRRAQAGSNAGYARDLYGQQQQQRQQYVQGQQAGRQGLLSSGLGVRTGALGQLAGLAPSSAQGAFGSLGGLQGFYQGQSDKAQQGQGDLVGQIAKTGGFGNLSSLGDALGINRLLGLKKRQQSQTPGTTGAQAPTPDMNPDY